MSWYRAEWFAAEQFASEWFRQQTEAVDECVSGPYVESGYWEFGYANCDVVVSGTAGGGTRVRFPRLPGMKPRDRRRRHEEDLLVVIL